MQLQNNCLRILRHNEPLKRHTSLGIGGPADAFAEPTSLDELVAITAWARERSLPVLVVGSGTNLLASDRGFRGCVVRLSRHPFTRLHIAITNDSEDVRVTCGAGVSTQQLVAAGRRQGFGPVATLAGLPGSIGGAVAMNAQNISAWIERVMLLTPQGTVEERTHEACGFGYRFTDLRGGLVLQTILRFQRVHDTTDTQRMRQILARRRATQELRLPSAGCMFKNPTGTLSAGALIDQSGLKGTRMGDACVSRQHANFIVNAGQSRAADVLRLMEHVQRQVVRNHGVYLEPEVRIIGERWAPTHPV